MSVSQQRFNRFVRPLTDRLRSRGQKKGDDQSSSRSAPAPLIFETLEPRILLAADPLGITAGYAFDETSGTTAADASGHGITGTLTNGPTFTPGKNGNAVTLDGVNDYVNLGNPTALQFTGSMTVGAWVYASAFPADDAAVVSKRAAGEVGFQLDITKDTGPRTIGFKLTDSTGGQMLRYGATTLQLNTWYYITGVYNAVNQSLDVYLNGALDNGTLQGTVTSSQQNSTANVTIGRRAGVTGFEFNGRIDDVRIADHALTQDQIQTDMVTPLGPSGPDVTAPTVSLTAPAANATIAGTVTVSASASDNVGVASVQFLLDGTNLGSADSTSPYSVSWNTTTATNGTHRLQARATDISGNTATTTDRFITVDNQAPTGTIVINSGATATNSRNATLTLSASDALSSVTQMRFSNTGTGAFSTAEPFATTKAWTLSSGAGTKTVFVQFMDSAGNWSTAAISDTIVLDTTAPTISGRTAGNITGSSATITWTTNEPATSRVEYGLTTSYGSTTTLDSALVTAHSVTITGLAPSTTYNWRVRSMDAAGNETVSANSTFTTAAVSDTTAPTVTWSGPPANSILLGTVTLTATASDNVAVAGVQFLLDGNTLLGTEDTTSPYSFSWNTTTASNGTHTLQARARDTSGNTATTAAISVTVDNLAPTGSVVINGNAPATRNTTVTLTLSASDTQGPVTQMRFSNDGTTFSAAEAYATSKSWALTSGDGTKTVYVQYQDVAGNWSTAATDTIVLDTTAPSTSAITATVVTSSSVTITWTTNEPSTSQVDYGPTTSYGSTTPLDSTLVTAHSVTLIGLTSNATYNFRVRSSDAVANEAVSANATFIIDTAAPSIPTGLTATAISSTQINLSWAASTDNVAVTGYQVLRGGTVIATVATTSYSNTGLTAGTNYVYTVKAVDAAGNVSAASGSANATTLASDTTAPSVAITTPTPTATVSGTVSVAANASDDVGVVGVQFLLDGNPLGNEDITSPYSVTWDTTTATNGSHNLTARARDAAGNATTAAISITVDNLAPTGTVVINGNAPATKTTTVPLTLSASDTQGAVAQMRFSNDGTTFSAAEAYATSKTWTLTSGDGTKTVYVQYQDVAGNWSTAATDTIVLDTTAPSTSAITATVVTSSSVTITWTTNEPSTSQVDYGPTTSYGSTTPLDSTLVTAHSVTLIGLTSNATYNFRVRSMDAAGNETVSANATFIIDTAAPSIPTGLTATAISSTQINLSWAASTDNVAVTGYQVLRGGIVIATVATTSYSNTGLTAGTNYVYTVKAVDAAGNVSAASGSANATTLASDTTAPSVAITTTPTLTTASGTSAALQLFETSFQQDLNGDGVIGPANGVSSPHFVYQGVDGNGVQLYSVTWDTLGSHPFAVRVLAPNHPSPDYEHNFLFALPVEAGLAQSTWGSGLDELRLLDVENQYNATIIEPIFPIDSWYADSATDATINFETFTATLLTAWVDSNFATSGTEKDLLIGFSKSGYGGLDLLFKHPSEFDAVAAFDFPADMAAYDAYGLSYINYGTDTNFQNNYRMTGTFIDTWKAPFTTEDRIWISEGPVFQTQVADFDALLTSHGVEHTLLTQTSDDHSWPGGWLSDAVTGLYGLETGLRQTEIEGLGSTSLVEGGSNYFLHPNGGSAVELSYAGAPVVDGEFDQSGGHWVPIGAEQTASGYEVAWKVAGADKYTVWNTDNSGNYVSSAFDVASGTVGVAANASDDVGVVGVQFLLDGNPLGNEDITSPYSVTWDTTTATNGTHNLTARARDAAGNATTAAISITVDNLAPTGTVVINGNAAATKTTTVPLTLSASDTQGAVAQMRFSNDGTTFSAAEAYATSKTWTLTSGDGTKTVYVQYQDAAGNWSTAATDTIVLDTIAPSTSAITATVVTSSSVTITWTTNEPSTSQVDYGPTTNYGSTTPLDSTLVTAHSVTLIGLTSNATYNFRVRSMDAAGNETVSANATFIIDTAAPSIPTGLTATAISSTQINLSWAASTDNVAVTGYQVLRGGTVIATVATTSYSNTGLTAGTNYVYTVKAVDAAGNVSAASGSANATTLASDTTAPSVAITTPAPTATVSGTVSVAANASDDVGVVGVQFLLDGNLLGAEDTTSPYSVNWDTTTATNGSHILTARARDAGGNATTSAQVPVTVSNTQATAPPAFVQVNSATPQTNQTQVSALYQSAQLAGDTNIIVIGWNNATSNITSVVDSAGNVYQIAAPVVRGSGISQAIYYAKNIKASAAGANSVTVTFNASTAFVDLRITEYSGLDKVNPLDVSQSASGTAATANSGAVTTTAANELLFAAGTTTGTFSGAGTGFTSRIITSPDTDIVEDRLVTATGSYSATAVQTGSAAWVMQMVTFKAG